MAWAKHSGNKPDSHAARDDLTSEPANIEFRCVTKRFGEIVASDRIDLRISAGEFLSLLGPSGCGKTTALRMIAGFEEPSEGDVLIVCCGCSGRQHSTRDRITDVSANRAILHMGDSANIGLVAPDHERGPGLP